MNKWLKKEFKQRVKTLVMRKYDLEAVKVLAEKDTKMAMKKVDMKKFGMDKYREYLMWQNILEYTEKVCRKNGWLDKDIWPKKGLDFSYIFRQVYEAAVKYSDVRMYYELEANKVKAESGVR
jgi:hypothetical protein